MLYGIYVRGAYASSSTSFGIWSDQELVRFTIISLLLSCTVVKYLSLYRRGQDLCSIPLIILSFSHAQDIFPRVVKHEQLAAASIVQTLYSVHHGYVIVSLFTFTHNVEIRRRHSMNDICFNNAASFKSCCLKKCKYASLYHG